jgi:hypothetical protein
MKNNKIVVVQNFQKTFNLYNNTNLGILTFSSQERSNEVKYYE